MSLRKRWRGFKARVQLVKLSAKVKKGVQFPPASAPDGLNGDQTGVRKLMDKGTSSFFDLFVHNGIGKVFTERVEMNLSLIPYSFCFLHGLEFCSGQNSTDFKRSKKQNRSHSPIASPASGKEVTRLELNNRRLMLNVGSVLEKTIGRNGSELKRQMKAENK